MQSHRSPRKMFQYGSFLATFVLLGLVGCGPAETPAVFAEGGGDNPLDGGVLSDDGKQFTLNTEGAALTEVRVSDGAELGFNSELTETSGVAAVNRIVTPDDDSADFDAERQTLTVSANFPIVGQQTFTIDTGGILDNVLGSSTQRAPNQESTDCQTIVDAVDNFCEVFLQKEGATLPQVIELALNEAESAGIPEIAFGTIESLITDFFKVIRDFCDAWTELREGNPPETEPINPCDAL